MLSQQECKLRGAPSTLLSTVRPSAPSPSAATNIRPPRLVLRSMNCRLPGCCCCCCCWALRSAPAAQAPPSPPRGAGATQPGCKRLPLIRLPEGACPAANGLLCALQADMVAPESQPLMPVTPKLCVPGGCDRLDEGRAGRRRGEVHRVLLSQAAFNLRPA